MSSIIIENFKGGRDTRRSALSSVPGTLVICENAHITEGGKVEKRRAFATDLVQFPSGTFGLQDTEDGLVTFGSSDLSASTFPTGVTYQRLQHPSRTDATPVTYNADYHAMTALIYSCNFNGKAFVIAQFGTSSGAISRYCYYDGSIVQQSRNGLVLYGQNGLSALSEDLARQIDAVTGWDGVANNDGFMGSRNGFTNMRSPGGVYMGQTAEKSSTAGIIGMRTPNEYRDANGVWIQDIDQGIIPGTRASLKFKVTYALGATYTITAPGTEGGDDIDIAGGPVAAITDDKTTALAIAGCINAFTYHTGYSAMRAGVALDEVWVYAPLSFGVFTGELHVNSSGGGSTSAGTSADPLIPRVDFTEASTDYPYRGGTAKAVTLSVRLSNFDYSTGDKPVSAWYLVGPTKPADDDWWTEVANGRWIYPSTRRIVGDILPYTLEGGQDPQVEVIRGDRRWDAVGSGVASVTLRVSLSSETQGISATGDYTVTMRWL